MSFTKSSMQAHRISPPDLTVVREVDVPFGAVAVLIPPEAQRFTWAIDHGWFDARASRGAAFRIPEWARDGATRKLYLERDAPVHFMPETAVGIGPVDHPHASKGRLLSSTVYDAAGFDDAGSSQFFIPVSGANAWTISSGAAADWAGVDQYTRKIICGLDVTAGAANAVIAGAFALGDRIARDGSWGIFTDSDRAQESGTTTIPQPSSNNLSGFKLLTFEFHVSAEEVDWMTIIGADPVLWCSRVLFNANISGAARLSVRRYATT